MNLKTILNLRMLTGVMILLCIYTLYLFNRLHTTVFHPVIRRINLHSKLIPHEKSPPTPITIVTGYFQFNKSKHSRNDFMVWTKNLLSRVETPMIIFTSPSEQEMMKTFRDGKPTYFVLLNEVWDMPWIQKRNIKEKYIENHEKDPEKFRHSPELYAVWNSKPWMVSHSAGINPFHSVYFFWADIDALKTVGPKIDVSKFPTVEKAIETFGMDDRKANFQKFQLFSLRAFQNFKIHPESNKFEDIMSNGRFEFIIGGFFGGTIPSAKWFSSVYYETHDKLLEEGYFVGKEQTLLNWVAVKYPEKLLIVCPCNENPWTCGNKWFYYEVWYAHNGKTCNKASSMNMLDFLIQNKNNTTTTTTASSV